MALNHAALTATWYLYNIDRKERAEDLLGTLDKLLFSETFDHDPGGHMALINSMRTPCLPKEVDEWLTTGRTAAQQNGIGKLPVELLDMVFDELDMRNVLFLALACKSLLLVAKRHVLAVLQRLLAPWQNCRLVLMHSDSLSKHRLPAKLLTAAERKEIASVRRLDQDAAEINTADFRRYALPQYKPVLGRSDPLYNLRKHVPKVLRGQTSTARLYEGRDGAERCRAGPSDYHLFSVLWGCAGVAYPEGAAVLCNVSKGQYVREDELTVSEDYDVTLAHVLLVRIVWSPGAPMLLPCSEKALQELRHGPWAGDRFIVATTDTLPRLEHGVPEWTDVTAEVDRLLWNIFKTNDTGGFIVRAGS